ncbi:MAG TPA: AMP-binding protein [Bacteroides reticulotermitis]|nr:AMP-binding protein [Bacteroides reticulotermitis]
MEQSFIAYIENSIKNNWDLDALTDYKGATLQYKDVARKIEKIHIIFEESGIRKGDKIAVCGRNSSHWGVTFLATLTYGAVVVPILHEFKADNVHNIVNHSEAKLLFVGDMVWENLNESAMPLLEGILMMNDFTVLVSRSERLTYAREHLNELFGKKYPKNFRKEHIVYHQDHPEELAVINYTSGTTSYSKVVMLPYRSLWSNTKFAFEVLPLQAGDKIVSMLPMAHMYGLAFEFLYEFAVGCQIYFLTRMPSPKIIFQAFAEVKPRLIVAVPLIIEKIIKKSVLPKLETPTMKLLLKVPIINDKIKSTVREEVIKGFGGNFASVIVGGAAFNQEVEQFLKMIEFPYTVGYGMTECGPIICYEDWATFKQGSCGTAAPRMEVKILSSDPENIPGEIVCRGPNVMLGYYKNEEATKEVIDKDGWLHTGDLALIDAQGNVTIKGRSKNMLLSGSGQNIYPEEIEDKLNNLPYVAESIIVQQNERLVGLVYPDFDEAFASGLTHDDIERVMEENRIALNALLPTYSQIAKMKIYPEEFEKTPKKSIKRFLYQEAKG